MFIFLMKILYDLLAKTMEIIISKQIGIKFLQMVMRWFLKCIFVLVLQ